VRLLDGIARSDPAESAFLRNELSPEWENSAWFVVSLASGGKNYGTNCHRQRGPPHTGEAFPVIRSRNFEVPENISNT
jgi:hypothetical protein